MDVAGHTDASVGFMCRETIDVTYVKYLVFMFRFSCVLVGVAFSGCDSAWCGGGGEAEAEAARNHTHTVGRKFAGNCE